MGSNGGFHMEEVGRKPYLVYHHPKYHPISQTQSLIPSGEAASHEPLQLVFLCPKPRLDEALITNTTDSIFFPINSSPEYALSTTRVCDHPVLPLFWCNNKDFDDNSKCYRCFHSNFGTGYYLCDYCNETFHKECVESPFEIKHPYHPEHPLQLYFHYFSSKINECLCCGRRAILLSYHCTICQTFMHPICAMKSIPFVVDQPKRHDHPLTFFPRQTSLTCNVCGLLRKIYPTYVCVRCNFVAHSDCMYSPRVIKISRHHHRISYISSLRSLERPCGVCRQSIDGDYGAYACVKCSDYVVHPRCALRKNVCDGEELENVPEEDDITQDAGPFDMISEKVILHFLHDHHLLLESNILYDENKLCQACALPIYEGNFYSCMKCHFILHETCVNAPRRIQHALHPHTLTLKAISGYGIGIFTCNACDQICGGFVYECHTGNCSFDLDVRCASISEPFDYKGHEHPLFLALDTVEKPICHVCKTECYTQLNCIKCDFIVCTKCATLPYKIRYKHDKHFLTVLCGEEVWEKDWCEVCERDLGDTDTKVFYWCNECSTTFHVECLLGGDPYMKPGQFYKENGKEVQILGKGNLSRPFCDSCKNRCEGKIFKRDNRVACSRECAYKVFIKDV